MKRRILTNTKMRGIPMNLIGNHRENSYISEDIILYDAFATDAALETSSIRNSTYQTGGIPGNSSGMTSVKLRTIGTSRTLFFVTDLPTIISKLLTLQDLNR